MLSPKEMLQKAEELTALADRGLGGDRPAYVEYQAKLFKLHNDATPETEVSRRWIAEQCYLAEERHIPEARDVEPVSAAELLARVQAEMAQRTRMRHPMSAYFFDGTPSRAEIRAFIRHHWLRSCLFFTLVAELAIHLPDFADWSVLYDNLYDETGEGDATRAHPVLLRRLMEYLDLPTDYRAHTDLTEEQAYLNNRIRCVRHPDPAWGLAALYAIEITTSANHLSIYRMLRKAGVPEEACEFHRLHGEVDDGHAEKLWELVERRAERPGFQATFMRSLRHHFALSSTYFDVLWRDMQRAKQ